MITHDSLFTHLKPIIDYPTTKHYLLSCSKVLGIKTIKKKWVVHLTTHDSLFIHLKPTTHYLATKHYLLP
jgi:hypothetical protein